MLLRENDIPFEREKHLSLVYHGVVLQHDFFYDFLCYGVIGIELKATAELTGEHESQLINYLHVGHHYLGLLLNFGTTSLQYKFIPNRPDYKK